MAKRAKNSTQTPPEASSPAKKPRTAAAQRQNALGAQQPVKGVNEVSQEAGDCLVIGNGDCGQLGLGEDVSEKLRPGKVELPSQAKALVVTAGGMHTLCIASGNRLFSWGVNDEAALGRNAGGEPWSKAGLAHPEASDVPGLVQMPEEAAALVSVSAGDSHSAALTADGHVYAWGTFRDEAGVMGFSAQDKFALRPQLIWQPRQAHYQVLEIASGCDHVAARCAGGNILTWGSGRTGQLGRTGSRMSDRAHADLDIFTRPAPMHMPLSLRGKPRAITCGWYNTFVLLEDGAVYACGLNNYAQLGFASGDPRVFAPKRAKQLGTWQIEQIAAGQHHTLALARDGTVLGFGRPTYGRLGITGVDTESDALVRTPQALQIAELEGKVEGIAAGDAVSGCFSKQMCGLFLCGSNTSGMLAKGSDEDDEFEMARVKRTKTFNEIRVTRLSFGGQHVAMLAVPHTEAS